MQNYYRVHVQLGKKDRQQLGGMLTKGRESARVLRRASILRQLDGGQKAAQVAANVGVAAKTVRAVARRYEEEGLESALQEKPRPGKCLVPAFGGAYFSREWKEALWDRYCTGAPQRQRRSVERYSIV